MSTPPGAMSFWSLYAGRDWPQSRVRRGATPIAWSRACDFGVWEDLGAPIDLSPHAAAEIAALAAMTPDDRSAFVERFNADTEVWQAMWENVAQRHAERATERLEKSDTGVEGFIPLPKMTDPTLGGEPFVSDAEWAAQNRRANEMLCRGNDSPRGETLERRLERGREGE